MCSGNDGAAQAATASNYDYILAVEALCLHSVPSCFDGQSRPSVVYYISEYLLAYVEKYTSKNSHCQEAARNTHQMALDADGRMWSTLMNQQKQARPVVRRARGLQRIASILDAAEIVFAHMGYEEATTNHIAAQAGISPGSLYQFFSNKEEIAQALATRYTEELRVAYDFVFSVEAASLPFSPWLDQVVDTLLAFHYAHPAFLVLLTTPISSHVTSLTNALPEDMLSNFALGFERRAPTLSPTQLHLSATMCASCIKAVLLLIMEAEGEQRRLLVSELKTVLDRYLEPLLGCATLPGCTKRFSDGR